MFVPSIAARLLSGSFSATTDSASVCAYSTRDGRTVVDLGDTAVGPGQSAGSVLAAESTQAAAGGYRTSRVTLAGRHPAVLEDGRPYVVQIVWVQRGRTLTLTLSPPGAATPSVLTRAATALAVRLG